MTLSTLNKRRECKNFKKVRKSVSQRENKIGAFAQLAIEMIYVLEVMYSSCATTIDDVSTQTLFTVAIPKTSEVDLKQCLKIKRDDRTRRNNLLSCCSKLISRWDSVEDVMLQYSN